MKDQNNKRECNNDCLLQEKITEITGKIDLHEQRQENERKPTILLHSCCGPCSTSAVDQLIHDYDITIFFYNPNITDENEYLKRKEAQEKFIDSYNLNPDRKALLKYKEGKYDPERFYSAVNGHECDKEGGERCSICFRLRLEEAAEEAMLSGFDCFTTTLSVSPHKNYELISKLGNQMSMRTGLPFLPMDFKKKDGYNRSIQHSKKYGLYRQNYCGCDFSK